jgi:hypothetical protein
MKAEISSRCTPNFNLANTLTKKEKINNVTAETEEFFKKIFVIDTKKRITFTNIAKLSLFANYAKEL